MLVRHEHREFVQVPLDEVAQREHDPRPADHRDVAPLLPGLAGRGHRGIDVGRLGQRDLGLLLTGGRVPDRAPLVDAPVVSEPAIQCWIVRIRNFSLSYRYIRWSRLAAA
jgi:hypothetical protein